MTLQIRGLGPLFNFKNSKQLTRRGLITDPDLKKRMSAIQRSLESQLRSAFQIGEGVIPTDAQRLALTLSLPHDDCWTAIPELIVTSELVADGEEGVDITIERLP